MTKEQERMKRNLNPHKGAILAKVIWGAEYAKQGDGSMDFYDSLTPSRKRVCREIIVKIENAPNETEKA